MVADIQADTEDTVGDLAAANEEQAGMVTEVEESVQRLSGEESATGGVRDTATGLDVVSVPEDLPDDMLEFVIDMLSEEQLREVAAGNLDAADLL